MAIALQSTAQLVVERSQFLKLLPAVRAGGKMRMHIRRVHCGFRAPARFLQQSRQFGLSDMPVGIVIQI
jgi:hypothetical protein